MKYKQNREKSIILVIGYTVQRKHFLPIYIYIFLNKPVVSFSFPPSLPPPRAACSNVSWIGNGLHLCLAAPSKWDIPVERNIYAPRASYFASMYGNKTSNGNETFFFPPRISCLLDTETIVHEAENSLSVCGERTGLLS